MCCFFKYLMFVIESYKLLKRVMFCWYLSVFVSVDCLVFCPSSRLSIRHLVYIQLLLLTFVTLCRFNGKHTISMPLICIIYLYCSLNITVQY